MMLNIYNLFIFFSVNIFLSNLFYIREKKNITIIEFYILFIWHFLFSIIYFFYVVTYGGDTNGYIEYAKNFHELDRTRPFIIGNGASFIYNLVNFFHNKLNFDLINIISIFNLIGFVGLIYFFKTIKNIFKSIDAKNFIIRNLPYLIIFIPSLSFWSSGIGKEPFVFLSISLFVYGINKKNYNYSTILLSLIILFIVRYQFFIIMLFSLLFFFQINKIPNYIKDKKVVTLFLSGFIVANLLTKYFYGIHIFKLDSVLNSIFLKQQVIAGNLVTDFSVNYVKIILNYFFWPIQFDITSIQLKNILLLVLSVENIYIISLIVLILINSKIENFKNVNLAMLIYIILFLVTIPFATFNSGIAIRQKWSALVVLFVFLVSGLKSDKKIKV